MSDNNEVNQALFLQLTMSLMQTGMMQLGKIMNPMTQKIEKDINAAKATIDMLIMFRSKTAGNLKKDEEEFLGNAISSLQMNYVEELSTENKEKPSEKTE